MIVRTYQRRNRNTGRTFSDCEEESSSQDYLGGFSLGSSSQDSTSWEPKQRAKPPIGLCTSTLMEAQESGEMMEHVDEANFALDGLKPGQPLRIQRASLVSLLSIFSTAQQRRLLRTQGMAKPVIDAIVALSTDDPPTALAAAALFYVLASDGQDEHLLDSAVCIKFLLKLLLPSLPEASEKKGSLGSKILGVTANSSLLKVSSSGSDRGGVAILSKVRKLLSTMKELHTRSSDEDRDGDNFFGQELNSKWLALLTLEKACLSTVALEDTSGAVRRVGGHFKERLRELGGLDAVCDVVLNCFAILKEVLEDRGSNVVLKSSRTTKMAENVGLLLKCMKVMENATFLSEQNQKHLLEMNLKLKCEGLELSFIALVIKVIKTLSGLLLRHNSSGSDSGGREKYCITGNDVNDSHSSKNCTRKAELPISATQEEDLKGSRDVPSVACTANGGRGRRKVVKMSGSQDTVLNSIHFKKNKSSFTTISTSEFSAAGSNNEHALAGETFHSKDRLTSSNTGKTTQARSTGNRVPVGVKSLTGLGQQSSRPVEQKRTASFEFEDSQDPYEDSQDPYEFNDKELAPMKGTKANKNKKLKPLSVLTNNTNAELDMEVLPQFSDGIMDLMNGQDQYNYENELTNRQWAEVGTLLGDCLLSSVKVLMNLTNENPIGCHQVAVCGGLDTMASLIVDHYPLFQCHLFASSKNRGKDTSSESPVNGSCGLNQKDEQLSDQELDLLIVILGVLVNLVEKDTGNRARLAASSVTLPRSTGGSSEVRGCRRGVIALLCSIFLTRQGAGDAIHGVGMVATEANDEAAIMQSQREAENMIVEAYAALLLGFLSKESENARHSIALCLPDHSLKVLVPILERFVAFHLSLNMISSETHAAVADVIESCKQPI